MGIRAKVRRRLLGVAKKLSLAAKALALGGAAVFVTMVLAAPPPAPTPVALFGLAGMVALFISPFVGLFSMILRHGRRLLEGELTFDGSALELTHDDGTRYALGSSLRTAVVTPADEGHEVHIGLADGNELSILVDDQATAERLLDLVNMTHEERRTRVRWATAAHRGIFGGIGFGLTLVLGAVLTVLIPQPINSAACIFSVITPFLAAGALSQLFAWREVEVGTDGISWRIHGKRTYLPLHDVRRVEVQDETVIIDLADGTQRRFDVTKPGFAEGLRHRIEAVLAEVGQARGKQSLFARTEDTFDQWKERMRALLDRGGTFREQPIDVTDTVRVLEDPSADAEMRVGAALALGKLGDAELADRVRVVVDTCISPKLRIALTDAAAGDVEEVVVEAARKELRGS